MDLSDIQVVSDLVCLCAEQGVHHVILSPGSRNAPLTLSFTAHPEIHTYSVVDERSAAYVAIGMAQALQQPVAICCTSGTAAANYGPAVAEAYYQEIPLLVLTADRPPERIDQQAGQAIHQAGLFRAHVCHEVDLALDLGDVATVRYNQRRINQALAILSKGPVHINIPLREPLYGLAPVHTPPPLIRWMQQAPTLTGEAWDALDKIWQEASRIMVLAGMEGPDPILLQSLAPLQKDGRVVILGELLANLSEGPGITGLESLINPLSEADFGALRPDLLLTFGKGQINKQLKSLLRKHPPRFHWHIDPAGTAIDTYEALTHVVPLSPAALFSHYASLPPPQDSGYRQAWLDHQAQITQRHRTFMENCPFSDLSVIGLLAEAIPPAAAIQWGNSAVVRYGQLFSFPRTVAHYCNRGTSGIDGSLSTAVGFAMARPDQQVVCVLGDISFFYDSNALWNAQFPPNLWVVVVNNQGGGIFRLIQGPATQPQLPAYFETRHALRAREICAAFGLAYRQASDEKSLETALKGFFIGGEGPKLLEVITPASVNPEVFQAYYQALKS